MRRLGHRPRAWGKGGVRLGLQDILRQIDQDGAGTPAFRDLEGLGDHLRNPHRVPDNDRVFHDRHRHAEHVDFLEGIRPHQSGRHLAGQDDHRHAVQIGIGDAGQEIGGARPGGREAHAGLAGQARLGVGSERRRLFMTHQDMLQGRAGQRVIDGHDGAARITENPGHAEILQRPHDPVRTRVAGACLGRGLGLGQGRQHGHFQVQIRAFRCWRRLAATAFLRAGPHRFFRSDARDPCAAGRCIAVCRPGSP